MDKHKKGSHLKPVQIVNVYNLKKSGKSHSYIIKETGISNPTNVLKKLKQTAEDMRRGISVSESYKIAVNMINESQGFVTPDKKLSQESPDKYDRKTEAFEFLKQADDIYHHNLQVFVTMLIQDKLKEKDMAYKELKSDYDVLKNKARSSNWISNLQKQFI